MIPQNNKDNKIKIFHVVLFFLPFMFLINVGVKFNISVADFFMPFVIIVLLISKRYLQSTREVMKKHRYVLVYIYFLTLSMVLSLMIVIFTKADPSGIINILKIVINLGYFFFFLVIFNIEIESGKENILKVWNLSAIVVSFFCIFGVIFYYNGIKLGVTTGFRANGTFEDPNLAAAYLLISLGISIYYNVLRKSRLIGVNVFLIVAALLLTSSRGGVMGLIFGVVLVILFNWRNKGVRKFLKLGILLSIFVSLFVVVIKSSFGIDLYGSVADRINTYGSDDPSTAYRILLWSTSMELFKQYPILGVGPGEYIVHAKGLVPNINNIPHNTYLTFMSETGVIGFLAFIWLPVLVALKTLYRVKKGSEVSSFFLVSLIAIAVQALSVNLENFRVFWVFLAFLLVGFEKPRDNEKPTE